jgi:ElaB/YqjD/DUF883 family membrane-anchored ribosome-binding protein
MATEPQSRTTDKIAKAAHEAIDKMATGADQVEARVRQTAADAQSSMRERTDKAQRMSEDALANMRDYVHEHPIASLGMAFAAGIIFSALLRR